MSYTRYLPLLLALTLKPDKHEECSSKEVSEISPKIEEPAVNTFQKVKKIISPSKPENSKEIQKQLEENFWNSASEISDALNLFAFNSVVNTNDLNGIEFASIDFKMLEINYKICLENPENIDTNFKYNVVLFMNDEKISLKSNDINELAEDIRDYVQDSLLYPPEDANLGQ